MKTLRKGPPFLTVECGHCESLIEYSRDEVKLIKETVTSYWNPIILMVKEYIVCPECGQKIIANERWGYDHK